MRQSAGLRIKLPMMLAALAFSLSLYILVQSLQERAPRVLTVDLKAENLPARYTITRIPDDVSVFLEGTEDQLSQVNPQRLVAAVDLRAASPGRNSYRLHLIGLQGVPVRHQLIPDSVTIEVEPILERELPVTVEPIGELPPDLNLIYESATVTPDRISVTGPESEVERVQKVRALLDLSTIDAPNLEVTAVVEVLGERNRPVAPTVTPSDNFVTVRPAVAAAPEAKRVLVTPAFSGQPAFGYRIRSFEVKPNQVLIQGSSGPVAQVTTITTRAINIEGLTQNKTVTVELVLPQGVRIASPRRVQVEIKVAAEPERGP